MSVKKELFYLKILKNFRFNNWSKWKPIQIYQYECVEYLMLAKINTKTGNVKTKSVKMHGRNSYTQTGVINKPFDADEQIVNLTNHDL